MRIAILGGTFDPIHRGHLRIAREVTRRLCLDRVLFVTAARPPHKAKVPLSPARNRHAMVQLALRREKQFIPCDVELRAGGEKNYSIDTVRKIRARRKRRDELFFIMGADQFSEFRTWRSSEELLQSIALVVVSRPGLSLPQIVSRCDESLRRAVKRLPKSAGRLRSRRLHAQPPVAYLLPDLRIDISSSTIRARIAAGQKIRGGLDPAVAEYIQKHRLYRPETQNV